MSGICWVCSSVLTGSLVFGKCGHVFHDCCLCCPSESNSECPVCRRAVRFRGLFWELELQESRQLCKQEKHKLVKEEEEEEEAEEKRNQDHLEQLKRDSSALESELRGVLLQIRQAKAAEEKLELEIEPMEREVQRLNQMSKRLESQEAIAEKQSNSNCEILEKRISAMSGEIEGIRDKLAEYSQDALIGTDDWVNELLQEVEKIRKIPKQKLKEDVQFLWRVTRQKSLSLIDLNKERADLEKKLKKTKAPQRNS